jgi:hypothetical protein
VLVEFGEAGRDRDAVVELSTLIDADRAADLLQEWDAGEQGLALETVAGNLGDDHVPLSSAARSRLLAVAERWGVSEAVRRDLRWCPDPDVEDQPWRVVQDTDEALRILVELATEIGPGHALQGKDLTPWLACDDVLIRIDDRAAQAGRAPYLCAVAHPTWSRHRESPPWPTTALYPSAHPALDDLMRCFA